MASWDKVADLWLSLFHSKTIACIQIMTILRVLSVKRTTITDQEMKQKQTAYTASTVTISLVCFALPYLDESCFRKLGLDHTVYNCTDGWQMQVYNSCSSTACTAAQCRHIMQDTWPTQELHTLHCVLHSAAQQMQLRFRCDQPAKLMSVIIS